MSSSRPTGPAAAARLGRVAAAALGVLLLWALPPAAVGVAGVDLQVGLPTSSEDRPLLDLEADDPEVELRVRNTETEQREVRLYAVAATPTADGSFSLGGDGSAAWLGLEDQQVVLAGGEAVTRIATVDMGRVPEDATHVAVVLEAGTDSTLVTRAARVIELGDHEPAGLPGWLVLLASLLLAATVVAHVARARGGSRTGEPRRTGGGGAGTAASEEPPVPAGAR